MSLYWPKTHTSPSDLTVNRALPMHYMCVYVWLFRGKKNAALRKLVRQISSGAAIFTAERPQSILKVITSVTVKRRRSDSHEEDLTPWLSVMLMAFTSSSLSVNQKKYTLLNMLTVQHEIISCHQHITDSVVKISNRGSSKCLIAEMRNISNESL